VRGADATPSQSSTSVVRRLRSSGARAPIIVVTEHDSSTFLRDCMRAGAQDVLFMREASAKSIGSLIDDWGVRIGLARDIAASGVDPPSPLQLVGRSPAMRSVRGLIERVSHSSAPVLLSGETGTGKGLAARAIHAASAQRSGPFVAINCAATPPSLMESLMFGHVRGSFTGAFRRQRGHFESVGKGTILLDEVADIPLDLQAKLLRVVEDRLFRPVGAEIESPFAGRILAATNADVHERVGAGTFRADLFYRLRVLEIRMPSLAERQGDIPDLLALFASLAERPVALDDDAVDWLSRRPWPGNVRELKNAIDRLAVLCPNERVSRVQAQSIIGETPAPSPGELSQALEIIASAPGPLADRLYAVEEALVIHAVRAAGGNRSAAARALGVHRRVIDRHAPGAGPVQSRSGKAPFGS